MRGRRRGPPRRAPKDIFSPGAKKEQKKPTPQPPPKVQPIAPPIAVQPPKVAGSEKKKKLDKEVVKTKKEPVAIEEKTTGKAKGWQKEDATVWQSRHSARGVYFSLEDGWLGVLSG